MPENLLFKSLLCAYIYIYKKSVNVVHTLIVPLCLKVRSNVLIILTSRHRGKLKPNLPKLEVSSC